MSLIEDYANECRKKIKDFDETEVRCGLIGTSGSGKSTLINSIAGENIAAVGFIETTFEAQEFSHGGIVFTDLPGCGTKKWPQDTYIFDLDLLSYDCFILITAHRFTESDFFLFNELIEHGKPCFVVRNMFDKAVEDGLHDHDYEPHEVREIITNDIIENIPSIHSSRIYLTAARYPSKYDFGRLLQDIAASLEGLKKGRFYADMGAYSKEALKKKREIAEGRIPLYAGLSAANGANPIPGTDIAADLIILLNLAKQVSHIYGFDSRQFEYTKKFIQPKTAIIVAEKIAQFSAKYLAKEGISIVLKRIAVRTTAKSAAKWVPFVGPIVSAGIGWHATFIFGDQLVNEAEDLATSLLDELKADSETF